MNSFSYIINKIDAFLINESFSFKESLYQICKILKSNISYFDWVGFYFADHKNKELILESYIGDKTDHNKIPFGKGICGQVAISNKNFMVPNVKDQKNYISCNINVKSELVVPIFLNGKNIGQIDVDSNTLNPFNQNDVELLELVSSAVSKKMKKNKIILYELN